jgi:hypothetical protein
MDACIRLYKTSRYRELEKTLPNQQEYYIISHVYTSHELSIKDVSKNPNPQGSPYFICVSSKIGKPCNPTSSTNPFTPTPPP